ncbi:Acyl dehydratase [Paracoccus solventivorans]|uniref:Acyl dehydratase n=1 Tax=Paracoccus solventivorans TaxID=53463 RepID=A0A1M7K7S9_9RHOB|nr:MaoC family dehydratase [Paracoccus solventivorans]SHM61264.1 Acyl dehydratase [Paracoccus solventivorans]
MTSETGFKLPAADRWFEHYRPGDRYRFGPVEVTEQEIIEFARRYDPQSFHIDPQAAAAGLYGSIIASGWMTAALMMRLLVDGFLPSRAGLAAPGCDELRWLHPVRPGDRLWLRVEVLSARLSQSKPDRGIVSFRMEGENQDGVAVYRIIATGIYLRAPAAG